MANRLDPGPHAVGTVGEDGKGEVRFQEATGAVFASSVLGVFDGSIDASVLIEGAPAACRQGTPPVPCAAASNSPILAGR